MAIYGFDMWVMAPDIRMDDHGRPAADVDARKLSRQKRSA